MMKTVVTMTCWPKRINQLPIFLEKFFSTQTVKPDLFYIWLSTEEFPDHKIPDELVKQIELNNIILKWIDKNEYCHKRWKVYPDHYEDVVISLDEDRIYPYDLIEYANTVNTITNLYIPQTKEYHKAYLPSFCGQCIIPPNTFPLETYSEQYVKDRLLLSPKCDECWINTFLLKNNTKISIDLSLINPCEYDYACNIDETALHKNFNDKANMMYNTANYMRLKYGFNIDMNKVLECCNYILTCYSKS